MVVGAVMLPVGLSVAFMATFSTLSLGANLPVTHLAPTDDFAAALSGLNHRFHPVNSSLYHESNKSYSTVNMDSMNLEAFGVPIPPIGMLPPVIMRRGANESDFDAPTPDIDTNDMTEPVPMDTNTCGWPDLTPELWQNGLGDEVVDWAHRQAKAYDAWLPKHLERGHDHIPFHWYLTKAWTPRLAEDISQCNGGRFCSMVSCEYIRTDHGEQQRKLAFYAFKVFSNFWEDHAFIREDVREAITDMDLRTHGFVKEFTDSDKLVASLAQQKLIEAKRLHLIGTILMTLQPLLAMVGNVVAPGVGSAIMSGLSGSMVGAYMGASAMWQDNPRFGQDPHWKLTGETEALIRGTNDYMTQLIKNQTNAVISSPQSYVEVLSAGVYLKRNIRDLKRADNLKGQLRRLMINHLWNSAVVYIVRSESDNCVTDGRIAEQVKVCLPEDPNTIYEIIFLGVEKEGDTCGKKASYLRGPPGYLLLGEGDYYNISLAEVVRDSVAYKATNGYELRAPDGETFRTLLGQIENGVDQRSLYPIFTLPILESPKGYALSSINNKKGRNYPIMSGDCHWSNSIFSRHRVSDECNREHQKFLQRTGLFASEDYMHMTHDHKVKWDKSTPLHFDTEFPQAVKVKYAVKYIRDYAEKHAYTGHEDPEDDGTVDHKDDKHGKCNKHHARMHMNEANPPCRVY